MYVIDAQIDSLYHRLIRTKTRSNASYEETVSLLSRGGEEPQKQNTFENISLATLTWQTGKLGVRSKYSFCHLVSEIPPVFPNKTSETRLLH